MNYKKWEAGKKAGINFSSCYHFDDDTGGNVCGAMASYYMSMPGNIPDMPLCRNHKDQYKDFDHQELLAMMINLENFDHEKDEDDT